MMSSPTIYDMYGNLVFMIEQDESGTLPFADLRDVTKFRRKNIVSAGKSWGDPVAAYPLNFPIQIMGYNNGITVHMHHNRFEIRQDTTYPYKFSEEKIVNAASKITDEVLTYKVNHVGINISRIIEKDDAECYLRTKLFPSLANNPLLKKGGCAIGFIRTQGNDHETMTVNIDSGRASFANNHDPIFVDGIILNINIDCQISSEEQQEQEVRNFTNHLDRAYLDAKALFDKISRDILEIAL